MNSINSKSTLLHQLFERHADRYPNAPALISGPQMISYGSLEKEANRFAHFLRSEYTVETGTRVGLFLERSPSSIVAILGILKAGATYVPLDPSHPAERLALILKEAEIHCIVSDRPLETQAKALGLPVLFIDDETQPWSQVTSDRLNPVTLGIEENCLCYVLYTSGSTGRPKGVMTEHRNVVSFAEAFNKILGLSNQDRIYQGFSLGFDGSVEEMWMAYSNGAALVVPPRGSARFGNDLALLINESKATVYSTVPTSLSLISIDLPSVHTLIVSCERCPKEAVDHWATPQRRMLNVYGPTETTVNATVARCVPDHPVTIGKPLPGYELLILNDAQLPVTKGEKGELYIRGPGVARGYLGQPELTTKHFLPLSMPGETSAKPAYRTGDEVSLLASGELFFWGRLDNQVKIRGYRIELSEIEAVLAEHPALASVNALVMDRDGHQEIVAYITLKDPATTEPRAELLAMAQTRLPPVMIPAYLEVLKTLPLLASGKMDRSRLPPPTHPLVGTRTMVSPASPLEEMLVELVGRIFGQPNVSVLDDFFLVLGGYSLLAARLVTHLRDEYEHEVALRDVYAYPNVRSLATHLEVERLIHHEESRGSAQPKNQPNLKPVSSGTRIGVQMGQFLFSFLLYGCAGLLAMSALLPGFLFVQGDISVKQLVIAWALLTLSTWPTLLLLAVLGKWMIIGRLRAGSYPLWGSYFFRWWMVRQLQGLAAVQLLAGTPLLPLYLRLMGAKVGRRCHLETLLVGSPDLLELGNDVSIGAESQLLGYRIQAGALHLGTTILHDRVFVGVHSTIGLGCKLGPDSRLDDLSFLPDGSHLEAGQSAKGAPASFAEVILTPSRFARASNLRRFVFGSVYFFLIPGLAILTLPSTLPGLALWIWAFSQGGWLEAILCTPLVGLLTFLLYAAYLPLLKLVILPRMQPGIYRLESLGYLRKWISDALMASSKVILRPLYTTIYLPSWLRLMGAKIGRRAEISTVSQLSPELVEIGPQSFFADGSIISGRRAYGGQVELTLSSIGRRTFVGNSAILPVGTSLGDGCLLGCLSTPPTGIAKVADGTEWLGSPSFGLPFRKKMGGFADQVTLEPTAKLIAQRLLIDGLRILIPTTILSLQGLAIAAFSFSLWQQFGILVTLLVLPLLTMVVGAIGALLTVISKQIFIGTFVPIIQPLWSVFVWYNEAVNGIYESVLSPFLLPWMGTPFAAPWLRMLGCKIGHRVYLETTLFSEFDLVEIGDDTALNAGAIIQNHLFEDRIMKASKLKIGRRCTVGNMAVVLYDTEMHDDAIIGPLSLLMKGESLGAGSQWLGIPTSPAHFSLPACRPRPKEFLTLPTEITSPAIQSTLANKR